MYRVTSDSMARAGVTLVGAAAAAGLLGGALLAVLGEVGGSDNGPAPPGPEACPNPPCLPESWPPLSALPAALPLLLLGLAALAAGVTVVLGAERALRGSPRPLGTGALVLSGTLLVTIGTEIVPHLVNPCLVSQTPGLCAHGTEGADLAGRFHTLWHAAVGTLPLTVALWGLLRRWRPEALPARLTRGRP